MAGADNILGSYMSLRASLARAVMRIVPPKEIEDIVQETYVRVCEIENIDKISDFPSFLFKTARNLALDHVKRAESRLVVSVEEFRDAEVGEAERLSDKTFDQVASNEEFSRFCEGVRILPVQCRRAFVLRKVYGYSQREIAREMNISESTVEKHIAQGIKRCTQFMMWHGAQRQIGEQGIQSGRARRVTTSGKGDRS